LNEAATIRQRQLALEMRQLRGSLTADEVHAATGITASKLSRIESAHVRLQDEDVRKLATLYKLGDQQTERLLKQAHEARDSSIMKSFVGYDWPRALRGHLELEADAVRIESFTIDLVPGLLQTREYARALISDRPDLEEGTIDKRLDFRTKRQERVRLGSLELWAILDESAIHRLVGGPEVLAEQLQALADAPKNITVQVLPWSAGAHASCGTPFHLFRFPKWPSIVYQETLHQGIYRDDEHIVNEHMKILEAVRAVAMSPRESRALLQERVTQLQRSDVPRR
jgi:uncharacterized protein DUF5753/helix-turn-helix protein